MSSTPAPRLYLIASQETTHGRLLEAIGAALAAIATNGIEPGVVALQLREKTLGGRDLLAMARAVRDLTARAGVRFFVNDRVDVALAAGADGVHLGERSLAPQDAHAIAPGLALALSTHDPEELRAARAQRLPLAFAVFGPVFDTPSKRAYGPPQGPARLRAAVAAAGDLPVLALGGIDEDAEKLAAVQEAGAQGIACMRAVLGAADPGAALTSLLARMARAR